MSELNLNELLLAWVMTYGSPIVAGGLLLGAAGLPVPGTLIVIATGAFLRQEMLNLYITIPLGLVGAVTGDTLIFLLGRFARKWLQRRFGQSAAWQKANAFFIRRGGMAIYLTRWLLTPIAVPTNLVAGSSGYPFWKFFLFDLGGEVTWIVLYGGLGYAFGSQWELISDFVTNFSGLLLGLILLGAGSYLGFHYWRKKPVAPINRPVTPVSQGSHD